MTTKNLDNYTQVDLTESSSFWTNGEPGDARIELWADKGNVHVWAETNGDPVCGEDELRKLLLTTLEMDAEIVEKVLIGDLSDL